MIDLICGPCPAWIVSLLPRRKKRRTKAWRKNRRLRRQYLRWLSEVGAVQFRDLI